MELIVRLIVIHCLLIWVIFVVYATDDCSRFNETNKLEWHEKPTDRDFRRYIGEWWRVDCRVKNNPDVSVKLWKGKSPGREIKADGRKLKNTDNVFNLTDIDESDVGDYYCRACNESKDVGKIKIETDGKAFQNPIIMSNSSQNPTMNNRSTLTVEPGAKVQLLCVVAGYYYIYWYKNKVTPENKLQECDKDKVTPANMLCSNFYVLNRDKPNYTRQIELEVKNFSKVDEGSYICHVNRSLVKWVATDEVLITMKAAEKPTFLKFPMESITKKEGESLLEEIVVNGVPKPYVSCKKTTKDNTVTPLSSKNSISIAHLTFFRDNGTRFDCSASNTKGFIREHFSLNILVEPKINKDEKNRMKTISLDKTTNLTCRIDEANPKPDIQWAKSMSNKENANWIPIKVNDEAVEIYREILSVKSQTVYQLFYKCEANNSEGEDEFKWKVLAKQEGSESSTDFSSYLVAIIVVSVIIALFILFVIFIMYKRKKRYGGFYIFTLPPPPDYLKKLDQNKPLQEQSDKLPYLREWEFPRERITLLHELGSGTFGVVFLADAIGMASFRPRNILTEKRSQRRFPFVGLTKRNPYIFDETVVKTAVKTLKGNCNESDLADIRSELKILIHIGEHENVVNILGACTTDDDRPLLILEYCPHGNLKEFLRSRRDIYNPEWNEIDNLGLSITDLVNFAFQISKGMEFLISRKCIHRDLAARNVLVGEGYTAKIADFGLARNVYKDCEYVKKTAGILPLKWLAIEAIRDRIFNEKTDAWSYGIVLWEMFTLGGTPYPQLHVSDVYQALMNGHRMEPPKFCPKQMADMMSSCWHENPNERPPFSSIVHVLRNICERKSEPKVVYENLPNDTLDQDASSALITFS